ncbi:MAG: VanZ family protein [Planctomycetes bacterium]|nr:VanZ family protein [Planctomycetota bacterium]
MSARLQTTPADVLPPPRPRAGRSLAAVMLAWSLAVVALVTLAPFQFRPPADLRVEWHTSMFDVAVNCALLVVPGFLFRAWTGSNRDAYCVAPVLCAAVLSTGIEVAQSAVPGRCVSPSDVMTNALGAWFGAMTYDSIRRNLDLRLADRLLLELPLMGIVYLLVPLIWLSGEAAAEDGYRLVLTIPLGVMGGAILAALWRSRLRVAGVLSPTRITLVAAAWFVVAAAPALRHRPAWLLAGLAIVSVATRWATTSPWFLDDRERRFEVPTLRRVGGLYLLYLVVLAGWPWRTEVGDWHGAMTLPEIGTPPRLGPLFRLVEYFAAFTLGGYLIAESRGRRTETARTTLAWTVLPLLTFAAAFELLRGYAPDYGASMLRPAFAAAGAWFGAVIYGRQLAAVQAWIAWRAELSAETTRQVSAVHAPASVEVPSDGRAEQAVAEHAAPSAASN